MHVRGRRRGAVRWRGQTWVGRVVMRSGLLVVGMSRLISMVVTVIVVVIAVVIVDIVTIAVIVTAHIEVVTARLT